MHASTIESKQRNMYKLLDPIQQNMHAYNTHFELKTCMSSDK